MDTRWWEPLIRGSYDLPVEAEKSGISFDECDRTYEAPAKQAEEDVYNWWFCCDSLDEAEADGVSVARRHTGAQELNTLDDNSAHYAELTQVLAFEDAGKDPLPRYANLLAGADPAPLEKCEIAPCPPLRPSIL